MQLNPKIFFLLFFFPSSHSNSLPCLPPCNSPFALKAPGRLGYDPQLSLVAVTPAGLQKPPVTPLHTLPRARCLWTSSSPWGRDTAPALSPELGAAGGGVRLCWAPGGCGRAAVPAPRAEPPAPPARGRGRARREVSGAGRSAGNGAAIAAAALRGCRGVEKFPFPAFIRR